MKKYLAIIAAIMVADFALADTVLYYNNFDDASLGSIVDNYPSEWSWAYAQPDETNFAKVVEGGVGGTGRSLRFYTANKLLGTHTAIPNNANHSLSNNFRISFKVNFSVIKHFYFNSIDGLGEFGFVPDNYGYKAQGISVGFSTANDAPANSWIPVSYVINTNPDKRQLLRFEFNGCVYDNLNLDINTSCADAFPRFRLFSWGGGLDVRIDDLKIELIDRHVENANLIFKGNNLIELNEDSTILTIINESYEETNLKLSSDSRFIKLDGKTSFTNSIPAFGSFSFPVTINRSLLTNDYYMGTIIAQSDNLLTTYPIFIQSGAREKGYTYYKSYFNSFMSGKDIEEVDPAWENVSSVFSPIVEMDGEKALQLNFTPNSKINVKCKVPDGTGNSYDYKVSFKALIPSGFETYTWHNIGCFKDSGNFLNMNIHCDKNKNGVTLTRMGNICPLDTWIDVAYTFNFVPNDSHLTSVKFGNISSNFNIRLSGAIDSFDYLSFYENQGFSQCDPLYIKDLVIESTLPPISSNQFYVFLDSTDGGSISIEPNKSIFDLNEKITITATPFIEYKLDKVYSDDFETKNKISTYNVTHSTTIKANFSKVEHDINLLYYENFESYEIGTELVGSEAGWTYFNSSYTGTSTIVKDNNNKVLKLSKNADQTTAYDMIMTPVVRFSPDDKERQLTKINFNFRPGSDVDLFALYNIDKSTRFFYLNFNGNNGSCTSYPEGLNFDTVYNDGKYNECYIIYDALNGKILECGINDEIKSCDISCTGFSDEGYIRLSTQLNSMSTYHEVYYNSISIETIPRFSTPDIYVPEIIYFPLYSRNLSFSLFNGGPDAEIPFTIYSDSDWLEITPASGTLNDKTNISFNANSISSRGCYSANVTFDCDEFGKKNTQLIWQNGFIYQSHFDEMEIGDICSQDKRFKLIYEAGNADIVFDENIKCLRINSPETPYGCDIFLSGTEHIHSNSNLRISFLVKLDHTDSNAQLYFGAHGFGEFYLKENDNALNLSCTEVGYTFPVDLYDYTNKWVPISFVINQTTNTYKLLEMQLGNVTVKDINLYSTVSRSYSDSYPKLRFFTWNKPQILLNNIQCEVEEILAIATDCSGGGSIYLSPLKDTYNYGDIITINAIPLDGYELANVSCDDFYTTNSVSRYVVTHPVTIRAEFVKRQYRCSVTTIGEGSVTVTPQKDTYQYGDVLTLTAIPDREHAFGGFTGSVTSTNETVEIAVTDHLDINAEFYFDAYRLNLDTIGSGTVSVSPEKETYHKNEIVSLTATPDSEYAFEGYTGTASSTDQVMEIVMNQHHEITAEFYFDAYRLNLDTIGNGTVSVSPEKQTYHRNEIVTLNATPDSEYAFKSYTGTASSTDQVMEIVMNKHHEITAEFYFDAYRLNLDTIGSGTVSVSPEKDTYHRNEIVTLTATPESEYAFEGYTGTASSTDQTMEIVMDQHHDITAEFYFDAYRLTLNDGDHGTVSISPEKETYHRNEKVTLTAMPDNEYAFSGYTGTASSTNLVMEIVMDQHHEIGASFYFDAYKLNLTVGDNGTVGVSPEKETYHLNEKVTLTAVPDNGYAFSGYTGTAFSTNLVMEIVMNQHHEIDANFYFDAYRLNLEIIENGSVSISPEKETYHLNEKVTLIANPDSEYAFECYKGTASSTNHIMQITMNRHHEIAAAFYFDAYRLTLNTGDNGSVTVAPEKDTYHRNEKVTLTATPDSEYAFEGYTGTAESTNLVIEIVMNQHHDIDAEFYFDAYKLNLTVGDNGAVAVVPEKETYHRDEKVTLTATPNAEYAFSGYTGTAESTNLVMEITMNQHHEIAAEFYFDAYRLQVTAGDGGSVVYEPVKDTYHNEEEVTITATPEVGYSFANYTGTAESEENPLVIKMTQHHEITANFTNLEYVVTCETVVGGSVTLSPQQSSYHYNDEVTYSVEPESGYHFVELQGYEEVLTNLTGTIVVTEALTLKPVFELDEYSVTLSSTFGGTIELEPSQETYHYNDVVTVKDTPNEGYVLSKIVANGEELESSSYTITGDAEIKAVFVYGDQKPSGEGTEGAPYEIANIANLVWLSRNTQSAAGAYSVLTADIDLTICANWMDGLGFEPIGSLEAPFQGSFDGANFTIKGLYINDPELENAGLFGYVENSNIKNLNITEAEVVCSKNAGLLAGTLSNSSVEKIAVSGKVCAETNAALLVGYTDSTSIELASAEGYAEGNENIGGMVGLAKESEIKNAYTVAIVSGQNNVGGFVGNASGDTLSYGYAAGSVNSEGAQGGIFGADGQSEVVSTFFDKDLAEDNGYGNPVAAEDLLNRETYEGWDFDEIWDIDDGVGTPYFRYAVPEPFGILALLVLSCYLLKRD